MHFAVPVCLRVLLRLELSSRPATAWYPWVYARPLQELPRADLRGLPTTPTRNTAHRSPATTLLSVVRFRSLRWAKARRRINAPFQIGLPHRPVHHPPVYLELVPKSSRKPKTQTQNLYLHLSAPLTQIQFPTWKILLKTINSTQFRQVQKCLDDNNIEFHTYNLPPTAS